MAEETETTPVEDEGFISSSEAEVDDAHEQDDAPDSEAESENDAPPAEEVEEVDFQGRKYKVPTEIKRALLREDDYTRKTQEVAELRKQTESEKARIDEERVQLATLHKERIADHARVHALDTSIEQAEKGIDWNGWAQRVRQFQAEGRVAEAQADQFELNEARRQLQDLKDQRQAAQGDLQQKEAKLTQEQQQALERQRQQHATAIQQGYAQLPKIIPGWSPKLEVEVANFARSHGVDQQQLEAAVADPKNIKFLYLAMEGEKALKAKGSAQTIAAQQAVRPAAQVGGNAPAKKDQSKMSTAEWMEFERKRMAAKAKR